MTAVLPRSLRVHGLLNTGSAGALAPPLKAQSKYYEHELPKRILSRSALRAGGGARAPSKVGPCSKQNWFGTYQNTCRALRFVLL